MKGSKWKSQTCLAFQYRLITFERSLKKTAQHKKPPNKVKSFQFMRETTELKKLQTSVSEAMKYFWFYS